MWQGKIIWETTPENVSLSFHPWSSAGSGSAAAAARGRCHFQNKKGNSVSIRGGRTEQRRGFRSSNSKRTRLKKREGGKESYFHSVTRKGKREYPWVGDRLWVGSGTRQIEAYFHGNFGHSGLNRKANYVHRANSSYSTITYYLLSKDKISSG